MEQQGGKRMTKVIEAGSWSHHTYSHEEKEAFCNYVNYYLKDQEDLKSILPIDPHSENLFENVGNGILLCKMINHAVPGTILEKSINKKQDMNIYQKKENLNLAINSAKAVGCICVNITAPLILEKKEHIILGLVWQIIKIENVGKISLANNPFIIRLKNENEDINDLLKLTPDQLLLRWFNWHLKNAGHNRTVNNFTTDIKDGENYTILLNQIDGKKCDKSGLDMSEDERANKIIEDAVKLGVPRLLMAKDITKGIEKLNTLFVAQLFNTCPGLQATEEEYDAAKLLDDDAEGTREERSFRMWCNSLGIDDLYINNLYANFEDGLALLKILDKVQPGCVDWKKVEQKPNNKFKKLSNTNQCVKICKDELKFNMVNIGGVDIHNGEKKLILATMWLIIRKHTLNMIGNASEDDLLKWANSRVDQANQINAFKDPKISDCKFLFNLLASVEPRAIDQSIINEGEEPADKEHNAKYVLAVARKLGAQIFMVWEDITEVKPKMITVFIASIKHLADNHKQE